jgi:hypothetical protein
LGDDALDRRGLRLGAGHGHDGDQETDRDAEYLLPCLLLGAGRPNIGEW